MADAAPLPFDRRHLIGGLISAFALVALAREARAFARAGDGQALRWVSAQHEISESLAAGRLSGAQWALEVERLAREIDVDELMTLVRRSHLQPAGRGSPNDPEKRFVRFIDDNGEKRRLAYGAALFDFDRHNVITPHGHRHMVSAHLVVAGRFRVRNFDRLADEPGAIRLRPTRDYVAELGQVSTMCSERDNIHWFVPQAGPAATFDIVVSGLDRGQPDHLIQAVDPLRATRAQDGTLLAPIISFAESSERYTADL